MIYINDKLLDVKHFPAGEIMLNEMLEYTSNNSLDRITIRWNFSNNEELVTMLFLSKFFKDRKKDLIMPYIPYARMDRIKDNLSEVFTLKYFCELINSMMFDTVEVLDPHSDVCMGLINNVVDTSFIRDDNIKKLLEILRIDYLFFPDNGCAKRLSHLRHPNLVGFKKREWNTGIISSVKICGDEPKEPFDVLIVDDICSYGGTFYHSALELKNIGARNIYLYVSHCEKSILYGKNHKFYQLENGNIFFDKSKSDSNLLDCGLIEHVYTTDSIFTEQHEKITIM